MIKTLSITLTFFLLLSAMGSLAQQHAISVVIATTSAAGVAAGPIFDNQNKLALRPGYRAELLLKAGDLCGSNISFLIVPWKRALLLVEHGGADAAFSSSYKAERAIYGVYPMKNDQPDAYRAIRDYSYLLYTLPSSDLTWDGIKITGSGDKIAIERGSAALDLVKKLGLTAIELKGEEQMIDMLLAGRVDAMLAINSNVEVIMTGMPWLREKIMQHHPAVKSNLGYLMFSKTFYHQNTAITECIWNAIGTIRASGEYRILIKSYQHEVAEKL